MKDAYTFDRDDEGLAAGYDKHIGAYDRIFDRCGPGVVPGRVRRGDDGRPRRPRVHGAVRGGRERGRARARLRRQRRDRRAPTPSRSSCPPAPDAPGGGLDARADDRRGGRRARSASPRRAAEGLPGRGRGARAGDGGRARRPPRQRDQAAQRAWARRSASRARGGRRADRARPGSSARSAPTCRSCSTRRSRAPGGRLRHRRQRARTRTCAASSPAATSPSRRPTSAASRPATPSAARRSASSRRSRSATSSSSARATPSRWAPPTSTSRGRPSRSSGWAPTGSGPARIAAAAVEQFADEQGISWPRSLAPFDVELVVLGKPGTPERAFADRLYEELRHAGLDVLYDDRDAGPGEKFADAELLGVPAAPDGRAAHARRPGRSRSRCAAGASARSVPLEGAAEAVSELWRTLPVERPTAAQRVERARLTTRRLLGPRPLRAAAARDPGRRHPLNPWTIPNAIGFVRLALIPVFLVVAFSSDTGRDAWAATLFAVIGWGDYADGIAARVTGQYSRLGALLDPLVDRLLVVSGVVVCWHFDLLPRWALAVLVGPRALHAGRDALRARARGRPQDQLAGAPGRRPGAGGALLRDGRAARGRQVDALRRARLRAARDRPVPARRPAPGPRRTQDASPSS